MDNEAVVAVTIAAGAVVSWGVWLLRGLSMGDRLDTDEDLRDRERMLDEVERSFYKHEGRRLFGKRLD